MLVVRILLALVVTLAVAVVLLRWRKLRRDAARRSLRSLQQQLPSSPYQPARGFRVVGSMEPPLTRPAPARPSMRGPTQIIADGVGIDGDTLEPKGRHNQEWALERALHRTSSPFSWARIATALVIALALVVGVSVAVSLRHRHTRSAGPSVITTTTSTLPSTSTSTTSTSTSTSTTMPATLSAVSVVQDVATYAVGTAKYTVEVSTTKGPSWVVFQMGPKNTLEWQGNVVAGKSEQLQLTGPGLITLGSPADVNVTVNGSRVLLPSPLPPTLLVRISPAG